MSQEKLRIVALLTVKSNMTKELEELLSPLIKPTQQEQGCIQYLILKNLSNPTNFVLFEEWECQELFDKHVASDRIQAVAEKITSLLTKPPEVNLYRLIE
jgi:quinol monooxygenase YgiN